MIANGRSRNEIDADSQAATDLLPSITLSGLRLHAITERDCVVEIMRALDVGRGGWLITCNLDYLRRFVLNAAFAAMCRRADIAVADGMPLVWASRLQGNALPERVAGSTLISSLSQSAALNHRSVFLLGGREDTAERAAAALTERYPGLRIAGIDSPPMGFERHRDGIERISLKVREANPDIIYVALGSPKQEYLIEELRTQLPRAWWMGVGISFSFLCGEIRRAPLWIQTLGCEWIHRLVQEPRRLARRYLVHDAPFACRLLTKAILVRGEQLCRKGAG